MFSLKEFNSDLKTIESFLQIHHLSSFQRSERDVEKIFLFHAVHLKITNQGSKIEGFMWGPGLSDIYYEVDLSTQSTPLLEFVLGSGNPAADIVRVKAEIPKLSQTAKVRESSYFKKSGGGGKGKKGYYLEVGTAKDQALTNFKNALKDGIGSDDFVNFCIPRDFKMKFYKGSN